MVKSKNKDVIKGAIDESYKTKLVSLMSKSELTTKELRELEGISEKVWTNHVKVDLLKYTNNNRVKEIEDKALEFTELYANIKEKLGISLSKIKPKSEKHYYQLKVTVAQNYIIALQHLFDILQKRKVKGDLKEEMLKRVVCETESPYYRIKKLLQDVEVIYDDVSVYHLSKNDYENAHTYYFLLGEVIIKEIHYALKIEEDMLYELEDIGFLYYKAGHAFLRCHNIMKEKYLIVHYSTPITEYLHSNLSDVFNTGTIVQPPERLATRCLEKAQDILRRSGNRIYYLRCRDILYNLKAENKDFEFNISRIFVEICKNFIKNTNFITRAIDSPNRIKEEDVRDYFRSHINLMIEDIAVAENTKTVGYSDLTIFCKDFQDNIQEAVAEFKVWGRNSSGPHSYKNVLNQLRGYLSDFETFGIVVMVNPNQSSIKDKYVNNIIEKDRLYETNSLEEPFTEGAFINLKTKHHVKTNKEKTITIYHFILNISNLFSQRRKTT